MNCCPVICPGLIGKPALQVILPEAVVNTKLFFCEITIARVWNPSITTPVHVPGLNSTPLSDAETVNSELSTMELI